jgi:hypothetical protein
VKKIQGQERGRFFRRRPGTENYNFPRKHILKGNVTIEYFLIWGKKISVNFKETIDVHRNKGFLWETKIFVLCIVFKGQIGCFSYIIHVLELKARQIY